MYPAVYIAAMMNRTRDSRTTQATANADRPLRADTPLWDTPAASEAATIRIVNTAIRSTHSPKLNAGRRLNQQIVTA